MVHLLAFPIVSRVPAVGITNPHSSTSQCRSSYFNAMCLVYIGEPILEGYTDTYTLKPRRNSGYLTYGNE